jgi:hypothetical protein
MTTTQLKLARKQTMSVKNTKGYLMIALAAAIAAPAVLAPPAAADAGEYRYRTVLATETQQEKTKRIAARSVQQNVRAGTSDAASAAPRPTTRSYRFNFDVPVDEEQHYRD